MKGTSWSINNELRDLPSLSLAVHKAHTIPELLLWVLAETAKLIPSVVFTVYSRTLLLTRWNSIDPCNRISGIR